MKQESMISVDGDLHVAKRYVDGRCYAVRFAPHMGCDAIWESIWDDPIQANEWRPFDEGTGEFLD